MLGRSNLQLLVVVEAHLIDSVNAPNILINVNATGFDSNSGCIFQIQ
jgi:hypothetical protein